MALRALSKLGHTLTGSHAISCREHRPTYTSFYSAANTQLQGPHASPRSSWARPSSQQGDHDAPMYPTYASGLDEYEDDVEDEMDEYWEYEDVDEDGEVEECAEEGIAATFEYPTLPYAGSRGNCALHLFWDLDNKQSEFVDPSELLTNIERTLRHYGTLTFKYAVGNKATFNYVPPSVAMAREELKQLAATSTAEQLACGMCGRKFGTLVKMQKHFKELHQREFKKRTSNSSKKGRQKYYEQRKDKFFAAKEAAGLVKNKGTNLERHLQKFNFKCVQVQTRAEAADKKLISSALSRLKEIKNDGRHHILCLISDDSDFTSTLLRWKSCGMSTVAICDKRFRDQYPGADVTLSWHGVQHALYE